MKRIYLDYAATTPVDKEVLEVMLPFFTEQFDNPSALYSQKVKYELENARKQVANAVGAKPSEIIFTSGGTEANNLAIFGYARQFEKAHFITSEIEHDSVLEAFRQLEKEGHEITYLKVDRSGRISLEELEKAITAKTKLISIMTVNNEIGTIQDIEGISKIARSHEVLFHTDAVQAVGQIEVKAAMADMISLSGHKLYGPKGVGALYVDKSVKLKPLFWGGHQESGKRSGTENVPGIIALGYAVEQAIRQMPERLIHQEELGEYIMKELSEQEGFYLNGDVKWKSSAIYHYSIADVSTEALLTMLNLKGVSVSGGSACQAGSYRVSHVMKALKDKPENAHLRISIGKNTTMEEIQEFLKILKAVVSGLRK